MTFAQWSAIVFIAYVMLMAGMVAISLPSSEDDS